RPPGRPALSATHPNRAPPPASLGRRVEKAQHQGMAREERLHARPLHPSPATVNETHLAKAPRRRFLQIFLDDRSHVLRSEGVEIERVLDGKMDRLRIVHDALASARERIHDGPPPHDVSFPPLLLPRLPAHALHASP